MGHGDGSAAGDQLADVALPSGRMRGSDRVASDQQKSANDTTPRSVEHSSSEVGKSGVLIFCTILQQNFEHSELDLTDRTGHEAALVVPVVIRPSVPERILTHTATGERATQAPPLASPTETLAPRRSL